MKFFAVAARSGLALILAFITFASFGDSKTPAGLLVDGVRDPLVIDGAPRFTWMSRSTGRGETQTAYQILVASSPDNLAIGNANGWDSGKVFSDKSASVVYAGQTLPPGARFWWRVRVWDQMGRRPSPYSAPAFFDTGLDKWRAQYIWDGTTNPNNFAYFRKAFSLAQRPTLAKVYVTAHNDYLLYCNGHLLGRGPARCDPYYFGQYNGYDVTKLLKTGTNVFAAMAHWQGTFINGGVNAKPAFLLEARLDYPDGSSSTIGTDESWKTLADTAFIEDNATYFSGGGARNKKRAAIQPDSLRESASAADLDDPRWASMTVVVRSDYRTTFTPYGGAGGSSNRAAIQFDSRREPAGWRTIGFDDSQWASAIAVDRSDYHLFAQMAPAENEHAELKPVSVTLTDGAWLVDFGRCMNGWPKLTMRANHSGDVVRVEYFQMPGEQKPAGWDEYICSGETETWKPDFGRHASFQAIKITGYAGKLEAADARGIWAYCDADVAGHFRCSSSLLNSIYEMCERSARQNVQQDIISVDANREQSQWTADSWNIGNVLLYNDRDTMMIDEIVRDYAVEQLPNGNFPACCPAQRSRCIPEWSMYWPMLLWQQYLFSGDDSLLRTMSPRLTHFLEWIKKYQDPTTKLVDPLGWRISEYAGGNMPNGGYNIATACQYSENLLIASHVFSVLGQENQSEDYLRQAEAVKAGINSNLFNGQFYLARTDRKEMFPLASAWALRFDIVPESLKSKVLAAIEKAGKPNIGGYGGDAFYSGVLNAGGGDFAVRDLARYRFMLEANQANWESFNPGGGAANHAWTSYPGYLFQKYICGIQPTSGGFATFDVRPQTGGLTFAEGAVPTVKGLITTRWEKTAKGGFDLFATVPANTRASIYVPKLAAQSFTLTESGKTLWPSQGAIADPGVLAISEDGATIKCLAGAGIYRFRETPSESR